MTDPDSARPSTPTRPTRSSGGPGDRLIDRHDVLLADLDGTLYRGPVAVPGAVEAVRAAAADGVRTVYVTNNASRRPADVAAHLAELGFAADPPDVATSSQAGAAMLARMLPAGAPVLVVGTEALAEEIGGVGLTVTARGDDAAAVVQGHSPDTGWRVLAEATVALRAGAAWVACNLDPTLPTERGPMPGNGSMVAVLRSATRREPAVAGKPATALLTEAVQRTGARSALVVGDRLDTDIEGGRAAGLATLLVLTGVSDAAELLAAPPELRPDHVGADLAVLFRPVTETVVEPHPHWSVARTAAGLRLTAAGGDGDPVAALRALCAAHWADGGGAVTVRTGDAAARAALGALGLPADADPDPEPDADRAADPGAGSRVHAGEGER